jgi:mannose-6-phosphate isomerase-like protein (cupin superfamily)
MSGYTVTNLRELDDQAVKFGLSETQEARFATKPLGCEMSGISLQRVKPGKRLAGGHKHKQEEEVYVVVAGGGRAKLDDEVVELRQWDAVRVAPGTMRSFEGGPDGIELIAFGSRGLGIEDVESEPGWWGD